MTDAAARDVSYAQFAKTRSGRATIRAMETLLGRPRLLKMAEGYAERIDAGEPVFETFADLYRIRVAPDADALARIPRAGPLVVVANHPFGIADGMALGRLLELARGRDGFRVIAHKAFHRASALTRIIFPIRFDETREAQAENIATRKAALEFLNAGGCVGVFPGGTVSTSLRPFGPARDPRWRNFTAQMIRRSGAQVVPVYFDGRNSRLFQLVSRLHATPRMGLFIREFRRHVGADLTPVIGEPIAAADLPRDAHEMMRTLRAASYALAPGEGDDSLGLDLG